MLHDVLAENFGIKLYHSSTLGLYKLIYSSISLLNIYWLHRYTYHTIVPSDLPPVHSYYLPPLHNSLWEDQRILSILWKAYWGWCRKVRGHLVGTWEWGHPDVWIWTGRVSKCRLLLPQQLGNPVLRAWVV